MMKEGPYPMRGVVDIFFLETGATNPSSIRRLIYFRRELSWPVASTLYTGANNTHNDEEPSFRRYLISDTRIPHSI